jgi:hypothetical protein
MKEKIERMRREEAKSTLMAMAAFTNHRERERTKREGKTEQKKKHTKSLTVFRLRMWSNRFHVSCTVILHPKKISFALSVQPAGSFLFPYFSSSFVPSSLKPRGVARKRWREKERGRGGDKHENTDRTLLKKADDRTR